MVNFQETALLSSNSTVSPNLIERESEEDLYMYLLLGLFGIVANTIFLVVVCGVKKFRRPANYLLVNLSVSSILFSISVSIRMYEKANGSGFWPYGPFVCPVIAVVHRIPVCLTALTTLCISLDRSNNARRTSLSRLSAAEVLYRILSVWIFSVIISIPLGFTRGYDDTLPTTYKCVKILVWRNGAVNIAYGIIYMSMVHLLPAYILLRELIKTIIQMRFLARASTQEQATSALQARK